MSSAENTHLRHQLCSGFATANGEDPGGSAPVWKRCLVMELDEPWESEVAQSRHFPSTVSEVLEKAERRGVPTKLQCVIPDPEYSVEGYSRVMLFSRPESPFATYLKDEFEVRRSETGPLVEALLEEPGRLKDFERYRQDTSHLRDILVCTHGSHDICCASIGYPIYDALRNRYARELNGSLRVWRVSHLGGHRFAPNLVDLPEGRNWVRMGPDVLESFVLRNRPVSELRQFYRGWLGLSSPYEQVAEREVFMREGWEWTGRQVSSQLMTVEDDGRRAEVRIDSMDSAGGDSSAYRATVEQSHTVPKADCLSGERTGEAEQYTVSRLVKIR